ncbi:glycoside hydrolase family 2 TIM barrel-domain containing protein [Actinosynnema sp. NPDC047251]|uniref:Exo-beta-D-glucosaminidase n=1 Tax=Saccharothrix espanaensis (strain ATCC 51144 / DSM 44229 / JCM 9112 / NBRC 15066 / NRRL 15764) TaxID=1179773 RepID=K0KG08_SACES|nr:glycoside hydrolase family 2 TIM barrel-domain containing protein [Saccharothrix espanaensis]CCH35458.1 Exo-beta-D-glucosaminidase [Saccharothrix espanaensis DSM 44229]
MRSRALPLVAVLALTLAVPAAVAEPVPGGGARFEVAAAPGDVSTVPDWRMQSGARATQGGAAISTTSYADTGWLTVPARSTVLAGLIANGKYPDVNHGENLKQVDRADFTVPWWYRKVFTASPRAGSHTFLRLDGGVIARGEVWLNGALVADSNTVVGAYPTHEFDVTRLLREGDNALAIRASSADPKTDLSIHFIDWAQLPPDFNQGLFRDVRFATGGPVSLRFPRATADLPLPSLASATVTVQVDARNNTDAPVTADVSATIGLTPLRQRVSLAAKETRTVTFTQDVDRPRVWWPFQMGEQPLYTAALEAAVDGVGSDAAATTFGVREVTSALVQGARQFTVNGKPFLVRGGGWASDLFLRTDVRKIEDQLKLVRGMGMNTIRLEGKPENDELYDLADRYGIMLLTGWECCSKWEDYASFDAEDNRVAGESAHSEARRIRNHPSLLGFLIGSDAAPPAALEKVYLDALERADWNLPVISSAKALGSPKLGPPGLKMDGPYWWEPPDYWYTKRLGGAFGFASEIGPGPTVPELDELKKFLRPADIAKLTDYNAPQYHLSPSTTFTKFSFWGTALDGRYGRPTSPEQFVRKAQLANYETNRAQFEAFGRNFSDASKPATGVIYWMLNDAWPKMYWHLYDYYLATAGSYFGAKTALRPLHVQYSYDDRSLAVVNTGLSDVPGLTVQATVFNLDGTVKADETRPVSARGNGSVRAGTLPQPGGLSSTYFVRLLLKDANGSVVDRNVYWLSTKADKLNYNASTWYHTPQTEYADLKGLDKLRAGQVAVTTSSAEGSTDVTLRNTGASVAFFVRATIRKGVGGPEVLPTDWSDNYVTLWPGESLTLQARYRAADLGGATPSVEVIGHNVSRVVR